MQNETFHTTNLTQGDPMVAGVSADGWTQRIMEGEPIGTFYTYQYAGIVNGRSEYYVLDENGNRTGETVIISTGATAKYLGLEDEKKYAGMGVSACATCDGFFYRKKTVAVVGGGDTACEEAVYLAGLASKVYLVVRKPFLRASKIMQERVLNHPHITVLFEHNAVGLFGDNGVEGMHVVKRMGEALRQIQCIQSLCEFSHHAKNGHTLTWKF
jgi:thioredoxin reductase